MGPCNEAVFLGGVERRERAKPPGRAWPGAWPRPDGVASSPSRPGSRESSGTAARGDRLAVLGTVRGLWVPIYELGAVRLVATHPRVVGKASGMHLILKTTEVL